MLSIDQRPLRAKERERERHKYYYIAEQGIRIWDSSRKQVVFTEESV